MGEAWEFEAEVWLAEGGSWAFVTLPGEVDDDVRLLAGPRSGFGSVRVEVVLGATTWRTSVFPDKVRGFVLPLKSQVRRAEGVDVGDRVRLRLVLV
ncbi:hypothetical protein BKA08_000753 [Nocardioides marinisabuli]|uniref:DUF1905 domain-containing protein n=1 Tax=Nocardioides marinisabuli TaxID=419476 RepID=A0A7Y9JPL9_9ACTN|nr:DUF1905 domain-containing protein [Nocardioides marinisabuli]NYD56515.1 hypothetical protein [Nocardioides marinisabuli]